MAFNLDELIGDYLDYCNGQPPITWTEHRATWEPDTLHVSDLNACPRAVALRLRGEQEEERPPQEKRKFVLANFQHELIYKALDHANLLLDKEVPVPLPDGWSGTADFIAADFFDNTSGPSHFTVNVGDSKNPVAGAKKYIADYPKPEDIRQVSVYSRFLGDIYPELKEQDEGQVFYLPLGGASQWVPTRFVLLEPDDIHARMTALEDVRENVPDPLGLTLVWWRRTVYTAKDGSQSVSGDICHAPDWRCSYCRFQCPARAPKREQGSPPGPKLARASGKKGLTDIQPLGRKMMDQIEEFLLNDALNRKS